MLPVYLETRFDPKTKTIKHKYVVVEWLVNNIAMMLSNLNNMCENAVIKKQKKAATSHQLAE